MAMSRLVPLLEFNQGWALAPLGMFCLFQTTIPRLRLIVPKETSFRASYPMNADAHDRALKIIFPRIRELGTTEEILGEAENRWQHSAVRLA